MPRYNLTDPSVARNSYTPAAFQAAIYTPQVQDTTILQRSLAMREAREKEAMQQQADFNKAVGQLRTLVNPAENEWAADYINRLSAPMNEAIQYGDYGSAITSGALAGSQVLTSAEAVGRIRNQAEREKKLEEIRKDNKISSITKQRYEATNPYYAEDIKDENGNITGVTEWKPSWTPVEHYAVSDIQRLAASMTPEDVKVTDNSNTYSKLGTLDGTETTKLSDAELVLGSGTSSHYNEYRRKQESDLRGVVQELLKSHPEYKASLSQDFDDLRWMYQEAIKKSVDDSLSPEEQQDALNKANQYAESLKDCSGNIITDVNKYIEQTIFPMMKYMEYNNTVTRTNEGFTYNDGAFGAISKTKINKQLAAIDADLMFTTTTPGAPVTMNYGNYFTGQGMQNTNFNLAVGGIYLEDLRIKLKNKEITTEEFIELAQKGNAYEIK